MASIARVSRKHERGSMPKQFDRHRWDLLKAADPYHERMRTRLQATRKLTREALAVLCSLSGSIVKSSIVTLESSRA